LKGEAVEILSLQIGQPTSYGVDGAEDPLERPWVSAIDKQPVLGRVWLGPEGLAGDTQADRRNHGGPHMAALVYAADHYPRWREELDDSTLAYGAFGENITVDGATEHTTCVGDVFAVGDAMVEISKPRQPCQTLARKFRVRDMVKRVLQRQAFGWYVRVQQEGWLEPGMVFRLQDRPYPQWTVKEVERIMRQRADDPEAARRLAECQALPDDWRTQLAGRD
jgi:MOSC domain-containing protein YiiM